MKSFWKLQDAKAKVCSCTRMLVKLPKADDIAAEILRGK